MARRRACWTTGGGRTCDPQFGETVFCLHCFRTLGISGDQGTQLFYAGIALPEFEICKALLEASTGVFIAAGILVKDLVVIVDGSLEVAAAIVNLSQIKLGVAGEVGVSVDLYVLRELLRG